MNEWIFSYVLQKHKKVRSFNLQEKDFYLHVEKKSLDIVKIHII